MTSLWRHAQTKLSKNVLPSGGVLLTNSDYHTVSMAITPICDFTTNELVSNCRNPVTMTTWCDSLTNTRVFYTDIQSNGIPRNRLHCVLYYHLRTDFSNTNRTVSATVRIDFFTRPTITVVLYWAVFRAFLIYTFCAVYSITEACCRKQEHDECKSGQSNQNLKQKRAYNRNICFWIMCLEKLYKADLPIISVINPT